MVLQKVVLIIKHNNLCKGLCQATQYTNAQKFAIILNFPTFRNYYAVRGPQGGWNSSTSILPSSL